MPKGKGGFTKIGLWVNVYSQHVWGEKLKKSATGTSMVKKFENICTMFIAPKALMADSSPEFDNAAVWEACSGMNRKLLSRLKCLCVPDLGEDEYEKIGKDDIPANWPDHFDDALKYLNKCLVINTAHTPKSMASEEPKHADVIVQMAYMDQLHLDRYAAIVEHAEKRKVEFDRKVTVRAPKEVIFKVGQLMQGGPQDGAKMEAIKETWGEEEEKKADRVEVVVMGAEGNGANMLFESTELVEGREASGSPPLDSLHVE
ncbi:hypothetical protein H0H87_005605 [Tephrocybe sp. NHM501043]|nr:hypothetical protein H0H87_005605 [Tephrocybe sp. NHM501043]